MKRKKVLFINIADSFASISQSIDFTFWELFLQFLGIEKDKFSEGDNNIIIEGDNNVVTINEMFGYGSEVIIKGKNNNIVMNELLRKSNKVIIENCDNAPVCVGRFCDNIEEDVVLNKKGDIFIIENNFSKKT